MRSPIMNFRIEEKEGVRYLYSSESATQSALDLKQPHKIVMQNLEYLMGCLMFMPAPKKILMLGVGGGSLIHFFQHYLPQAQITGIELDGALIASMQTDFLLPKANTNLTYTIADAEQWLQKNTTTFDLIIVDLFDEQNMPSWVLSKNFINDLNRSLNANGCVAWNTLITSEHDFNDFYVSLRSVFSQRTLCLSAEDYENTLAYSFNFDLKQSDMGHLIQLAQQQHDHYELPFHEILNVIFNTNPIDSGFI